MLNTVSKSSVLSTAFGRALTLVVIVVSLLLGMANFANAAVPTGTVGGTLTVDLGRFGSVPASGLVVGLYNAGDGELAYATTAERDGSFYFVDVNPSDYVLALIDDYDYTIQGDVDIRVPNGSAHSQRDFTLLKVDGATQAQQVPTAVSLSNVQSATQTTVLTFAIVLTIGMATAFVTRRTS